MKISEKQLLHLINICYVVSTPFISLSESGAKEARELLYEINNQQSNEVKEIGDE